MVLNKLLTKRPFLSHLVRTGFYGQGPVLRVFAKDGRVAIGTEKFAYDPDTVMVWCQEEACVPQFCIDGRDRGQGMDGQRRCAAELIAQASAAQLAEIRILSPERETVEMIQKMDSGQVTVGTGRLAGHAWANGLNPFQIIPEEKEAGTGIVVFYAYEHNAQEIKNLMRCAFLNKIEIGFNVRDKENSGRDLIEYALLILSLGGTVFCNDPLRLESLVKNGWNSDFK